MAGLTRRALGGGLLASAAAPAAQTGYAPVNGLRMYYEVHGQARSDRPPLLLLHGGGGTMDFFRPALPLFTQTFQVIMVEQAGHGRTGDRSQAPFHYHTMGEDTVAFLDVMGVAKTHVFGFSDGGIVGLDLAIHHGDRIARLVTTGANTRVDGYTAEEQAATQNSHPADDPVSDDYRRLSPDGPRHWPAVQNKLRQLWLTEPNYTRAEIAGIQADTLLIYGDHDLVSLEHAIETFRTIPKAQLCIVPHSSHGAMPQETIRDFLSAQQSPA